MYISTASRSMIETAQQRGGFSRISGETRR